MARQAAVCIVSGGLDSVCFAATLARDYDLYMITFAYGQRAEREIGAARHFAKILKAKKIKFKIDYDKMLLIDVIKSRK